MTYYAIYSNAGEAERGVQDDTVIVHGSEILDHVENLADRDCRPWLLINLRTRGGCYVATNAGSPGREMYGRGFVVRPV